jgi:hypothetical protein
MLSEGDKAHVLAHWAKIKNHEDNIDFVRKKREFVFKKVAAFEAKHCDFDCFTASSEEIELYLKKKKQAFEVFYKDFIVYKDLIEFQKDILEDMMTRYCRFLEERDLQMDDDSYDNDLYKLVNNKMKIEN